MKRMIVIVMCAMVALANGAIAISQERQIEPSRQRAPRPGARMGGGVGESQVIISGDREIHFMGAELSFGGKLVKGAPYSAEAVTEHTQMLTDGNRIVRKSAAMVYRDSEGRTRREQTLRSVGPYAVAGEPAQTIFINDPVAGVNYILDPRDRTVRKMGMPRVVTSEDGAITNLTIARPDEAPLPDRITITEKMAIEATVAESHMKRRGAPVAIAAGGEASFEKPNVESLGKQTIEGVEAEGTRTTITIPAGKIGNEMPILIVSESWYSPELQVVVMTRHSDPRFGEQSYRLTGINRSEPAKTLFEVPSDYTIKEMMPADVRMKVEREKARQKHPNEQ